MIVAPPCDIMFIFHINNTYLINVYQLSFTHNLANEYAYPFDCDILPLIKMVKVGDNINPAKLTEEHLGKGEWDQPKQTTLKTQPHVNPISPLRQEVKKNGNQSHFPYVRITVTVNAAPRPSSVRIKIMCNRIKR